MTDINGLVYLLNLAGVALEHANAEIARLRERIAASEAADASEPSA